MSKSEIRNPKSEFPSNFDIRISNLSSGFTLAETLVALAVTAVIAVTLLSAISGMMAHLPGYLEQQRLCRAARALVDDWRANSCPREKAGVCPTQPDVTWSLTVVDAPLPAALKAAAVDGLFSESDDTTLAAAAAGTEAAVPGQAAGAASAPTGEHLLTVTTASGRSLTFRVFL